MIYARLLLVSVVCLGLALYLGRVVVSGLGSGTVRHSDSTSVCRKKTNPVGYWALITFFSLVAVGSVLVFGRVAYQIVAGN